MLELNKVLMVGNLTRDPEVKMTTGGNSVAKLGLAVNRRRFNRETGQSSEETMFIDADAWGRQAEFCQKYLAKGRRIFIEGRLQQDTWKDRETGANRSKIKIVADRVQFADPKPPEGGGGEVPRPAASNAPDWSGGSAPSNDAPPPAPPDTAAGGGDTEDDLPF